MSLWETPARGDDITLMTAASAIRVAAGSICPTPMHRCRSGKTGRCSLCVKAVASHRVKGGSAC